MSSITEEDKPFQHLCNIIKSIALEGAKCRTDEATTDLIKELSKIIQTSEDKTENKMEKKKQPEPQKESSSPFDKDFTCFLCRKKCFSKQRFLKHFCVHFKHSKALKRAAATISSDDDDDDEENGKSPPKRRPPRRLLQATAKMMNRQSVNKCGDDVDSGCHSVESSSGGSDHLESDCFLGDSESSDSDENDQENRIERRKIRTELLLMSHKERMMKNPEDNHDNFNRRVSQKDRLSLAEKQLDNNETEGLICLTCLKRFSNCQNLRRHLRLHIARDSNTPDIDRSSGSGSTNGDHDTDLDSGRFICDWCPARFENRSAARIHESSHKGQEYKCYVCEKVYADRYSLRYHLRTHGIGRQIRCEYCNKSFSKPSRLEAHVKSHHKNIRDFVCSVCNKAFKTSIHLRNHFRQHSGERPFACTICNDRFRHKASLIAHVRSHEGVRPFCCEVCGKTFREPSTLKAHSRVHTGDKPYKCQLCDKSFTQRAGLNYHKRSSHGQNPKKSQQKTNNNISYQNSQPTNLLLDENVLGKRDKQPLSMLQEHNPQEMVSMANKSELQPQPSSNIISTPSEQKLPSFDHLKNQTTNSNSPAVSSCPSPSLLGIQNSMPSPAASNCSVDSYHQAQQHYHIDNHQQLNTNHHQQTQQYGMRYSREVTPPLTPPNSSGMEDFLPAIEDTDFLSSLNASEISNQLCFDNNDYSMSSTNQQQYEYLRHQGGQQQMYTHQQHYQQQQMFQNFQMQQQQQQQYNNSYTSFNCPSNYYGSTTTSSQQQQQSYNHQNSIGETQQHHHHQQQQQSHHSSHHHHHVSHLNQMTAASLASSTSVSSMGLTSNFPLQQQSQQMDVNYPTSSVTSSQSAFHINSVGSSRGGVTSVST